MRNFLIFIVPLLFLTFGCKQNKQFEAIKFNQEEWLKGDRALRGKMVDNLLEDSILYGKSMPEVINMLGDPTASDAANPLVYQVDFGKKLGPFGLGGIWLFFLTVEFDSLNYKVSDVRYSD